MFRTLFKWIFITLIFCSPVAAEAQAQSQRPIPPPWIDTQQLYMGVSIGLFDGITTSYSTGLHGGWIGPTKTFRLIGGIAPEVSVSLDYIRNVHLERLRHITDMIVRETYAAGFVAGPRIGGKVGFSTLIGIAGGGGRAESRCSGAVDWILLASVDNGKSITTPTPRADGDVDPLCGKTDRRFPFAAEVGPDLRFGRMRIRLPVVVTSFGDSGSRRQYSYKFGVDFQIGGDR